MKIYLFSFCALLGLFANAQTIVKYYDIDWQETVPEKAAYSSEFTKVETGYKCLSYWKNSKKKREESFYADTSMAKPNGLQKVYHKNGNLEDSLLFNAAGQLSESFHFYGNRQLECHYVTVSNGTGKVLEAYDETGAKIKNYVFAQETAPKGGLKSWHNFLLKNASKELTSGNENLRTVSVKIRFIVDENGSVLKPKVIESSGIKAVDQDALRLLLTSPQWTPAIYKNKPIRYPVTLPITYELPPAKKK